MTYTKTEPLLAVEHVSLSFGERLILRDVNIKIRKIERAGIPTGRIVSFLGPSGTGKTVFMRMIAGLQVPTSGNIFMGKERTLAHPGLVGLVSQQYLTYPNRDVLGNLRVAAMQREHFSLLTALKTYFARRNDATKKSLDMLVHFDLSDKGDQYPAQLSGGQRQRVSIMQQLLCSDHFLLMDEPTAGLDPISKKNVCNLVTELANTGAGLTVIIVTHDIPTAVAISDTIWLMGRDRNANGSIIPGARIIDTYDCVECGLSWNPNVRNHPAYAPMIQELNDRFDTL